MSARRKSNRKNQPLVIGICAAILVLLGLVTQIPGVKESLGIQTDAPEPVARVSTAAVSGEYMRVHVLDCGQADAIVVTQGDAAMLIDAGESEHGKVVLDYLAELGVEELSFFVMTHPHADHIGGAKKVLEGVKVRTVILSHAEHTTKLYENTLDAVEASGAEVKPAKPGDVYTLGGAEFTILSPNPDKEYEDLNDYSVAFLMSYEGSSMLFTGDMGIKPEGEILEKGYNVKCSVLKSGHHGSKTASSQAFLDAADPDIIVMTVASDTKDNLPNAQTLERYEKTGAALYRSDRDGLIVLTFAGGQVSVDTERRAAA